MPAAHVLWALGTLILVRDSVAAAPLFPVKAWLAGRYAILALPWSTLVAYPSHVLVCSAAVGAYVAHRVVEAGVAVAARGIHAQATPDLAWRANGILDVDGAVALRPVKSRIATAFCALYAFRILVIHNAGALWLVVAVLWAAKRASLADGICLRNRAVAWHPEKSWVAVAELALCTPRKVSGDVWTVKDAHAQLCIEAGVVEPVPIFARGGGGGGGAR